MGSSETDNEDVRAQQRSVAARFVGITRSAMGPISFTCGGRTHTAQAGMLGRPRWRIAVNAPPCRNWCPDRGLRERPTQPIRLRAATGDVGGVSREVVPPPACRARVLTSCRASSTTLWISSGVAPRVSAWLTAAVRMGVRRVVVSVAASAGMCCVTRVPGAAAGVDETGGFELAISAGDGADRQAEVAGQLP